MAPVNSYCKQEHHEHAWPNIYYGRNMNLSAGLRLDAISAGASCSFLEACQSFYRVTAHVDVTYCLDIMHHALFTTCAYTPQQKISNYRSYRGVWVLVTVFQFGIFPNAQHLVQIFWQARVQALRGNILVVAAVFSSGMHAVVQLLGFSCSFFLSGARDVLSLRSACRKPWPAHLWSAFKQQFQSTWLRFQPRWCPHAGAAQPWGGYQ